MIVRHSNATAMLEINSEEAFFPLIFPSTDLTRDAKTSIQRLHLQSTNWKGYEKNTFLHQKKKRKVIWFSDSWLHRPPRGVKCSLTVISHLYSTKVSKAESHESKKSTLPSWCKYMEPWIITSWTGVTISSLIHFRWTSRISSSNLPLRILHGVRVFAYNW